ncbi:(2Fe-2S)-binding protein [Rhizobium sp. YIM 134829]|uniref:(2Fe-2S)-binding protein n=1 Tax=Rhizobium sp. YIM 134829 TaxID=3390453 RepID=UPI003979C349
MREDPHPDQDAAKSSFLISRRDVMMGSAAVAVAVNTAQPMQAQTIADEAALPVSAEKTCLVQTTINGMAFDIQVDARTSLLDLLRDRLGLTGAKKGCDHGQCGACTVLVDGRRIASCLTFAAKIDGHAVTTIEGLSDDGSLHPMQKAFIDHDALQCGYCTPGQIMAAVACVQEGNATSAERIRESMSGNICRCGAYVGILAAIQDAAVQMRRT